MKLYVTLCLLIAVCGFVSAQSGRRPRKPEPQPAVPVETPTPTPAPTPKPTPAIKFLVAIERYGELLRVSINDYDGVLRNCTDRLDKAPSVKADPATHDMSRADAIRQAKSEKDTYVVWLQLRVNEMTGNSGIQNDQSNLYIEYHVYAPVTGKQETQGNTYPEAYRSTIRLPTPTSQGDYQLNQAARGAAERILDHFHVRALPGS
jgi:hypothetical protein